MKLERVCEDLTANGRCIPISELEGKYLTEAEGSTLSASDWYYTFVTNSSEEEEPVYQDIELITSQQGTYAEVREDFESNKILVIFAVPKDTVVDGKKLSELTDLIQFSITTETVFKVTITPEPKFLLYIEYKN